MPILPPISPIGAGALPVGPAGPAARAERTAADESKATESNAAGFASAFSGALDQLETSHRATDELAKAAATGDLTRVEDLMVSMTETQLTTQLTVATRNRAIESFNDIMRMQV